MRDTNNTVLFNGIDSCYIADSTFLRGKYFYQIWGTNPLYAGGQLYTDSAGHIIHSSLGRTISLTHNDSLFDAYTNYGNGEWSHLYTVMKTFPTSTYSHNNKTYIDCISKYEYCYNNIDTACTNNKVMFNIYAPNVGVVYSRYYYLTTCNIFEEKLLRYKVYWFF